MTTPLSGPDRTRVAPPLFDVMICHDCCCGTDRKHPGIDHQAQREALLAMGSQEVRVSVVACLDVCERSNVVLVRQHDRPRPVRDTWLAGILYPSQVTATTEWVRSRRTTVPEALARNVFHPPEGTAHHDRHRQLHPAPRPRAPAVR